MNSSFIKVLSILLLLILIHWKEVQELLRILKIQVYIIEVI